MSYFLTTEELKARAQNGGLAMAGTFAITSLSCYRTSQELYYHPDPIKVVKVSAIISFIAGIIWALMPRAKDSPESNVDEVKSTVLKPINVLLGRVLQIQKETHTEIASAREKYLRDRERQRSFATNVNDKFSRPAYGSTSSPTWYSTSSPGIINPSRPDSYSRGWQKVEAAKGFSAVFEGDDERDDDDGDIDEELEQFYRDLEDQDDRDLP